jgi:O-antigen biosynthesis protein
VTPPPKVTSGRQRILAASERHASGRWAKETYRVSRIASRLAAARAFDVEYYLAQVGSPDSGNQAALIRHYVRIGRRKGLSPHPLIEPSMLPMPLRSKAEPLLTLLEPRNPDPAPHPLVDLDAWSKTHPDADAHPTGRFGHLLAALDDEVAIPTQQRFALGPVAYGDLRRHMLDVLHEIARQEVLLSGRVSEDFDESAHRAELNRLRERADIAGESAQVAVVMPVRDRATQVARAIASVRNQSWPHWRLIVVDDGSVDETPDVVEALAASDPRIELIRTAGHGVCAARNTALSHAREPYIAFLDSDNEWFAEYLRTMVGALSLTGHDAAYAVVQFEEDGVTRFRAHRATHESMQAGASVDINVLVARREAIEAIGGFDESLRRMVDWDLTLRLSANGPMDLVPTVGVDYDFDVSRDDRISVRESPTWAAVVKSKSMVDWDAVRATSAGRDAAQISLLVAAGDNLYGALATATAALAKSVDQAQITDVLVVADGASSTTSRILSSCLGLHPRISVLLRPRPFGRSVAWNVAAQQAAGGTLVLASPGVRLSPSNAASLLDRLDVQGADAGTTGMVAPVVLDATAQIKDAGLAWLRDDPLPHRILAGHPVEDLIPVIEHRRQRHDEVAALSGDVVMLRTSVFADLDGLDPLFGDGLAIADLALRLRERGMVSRLVPDVRVPMTATASTYSPRFIADQLEAERFAAAAFVDRWSSQRPQSDEGDWLAAGLHVAHLAPERYDTIEIGDVHRANRGRRSEPIVVRPRSTVPAGPAAGLPSLRWAIRIAAPVGPRGDVWGDVSFAADLAASLRRLGQTVIVDRREAHTRATEYLDDVVLVLRGLDQVAASPGRTTVLWVISHPDEVTPNEVIGYDLAFGAGRAWCTHMTERSGRQVRTLLQATDPQRFTANHHRDESGEVLFVGSSRGIFRPIVRDALAAGLTPVIVGPDWDPFLGPDPQRTKGIPNDQLPAAYAAADVVLNDHWADMAKWGFVSNRVFDAVACGTRVVSDDMPDIEELFPGMVRVYRDTEHLARLVNERSTEFGDEHSRTAAVDAIRDHHSFDARARTLFDAVLAHRGVAR